MKQLIVLLVDQDEANRMLLTQMLQKKSYEIYQADQGATGLQLARNTSPSIIIVDPALPDMELSKFVNGIKQNKQTSHIPIVALSSHSNPEEMQNCLQLGCVEYYVKSGMVMISLVDSIPRLVLESQRSQTGENDEGLLIAFLSAKGGTGTSSLCANIGMNIASQMSPSSVVVVDMVLPFGSIGPIVGQDDETFNLVTVSTEERAVINPEYFRERLPVVPQWLFHLLPGSPDPETAGRLNVENLSHTIEILRRTYDYVLVDLGRSLSRISLPVIENASLITLVTGIDLSAVASTKIVWDYLNNLGVHENRMFPILNRAVGLEGLTKSEAEKILGLEIKLMVPYMMGNFTLANNQHIPVSVKYPTDTVSMVLKQAALDMSHQAIEVSEGK
jgi:pilus assembly protein CpaE